MLVPKRERRTDSDNYSRKQAMKMKYIFATAAILGVSYLLLMAHFTTLAVAQDGSGSKPGSGKKSGSSKRSAVKQPIELGKVAWGRDLDEAVAKARKSNKPIALLFQEVPG